MSAASWFLVMFAGSQYIGPLPADACQRAAIELQSQGVVCRQATTMYACPVAGMQNVYTSCPEFGFPQVTVKEPR